MTEGPIIELLQLICGGGRTCHMVRDILAQGPWGPAVAVLPGYCSPRIVLTGEGSGRGLFVIWHGVGLVVISRIG